MSPWDGCRCPPRLRSNSALLFALQSPCLLVSPWAQLKVGRAGDEREREESQAISSQLPSRSGVWLWQWLHLPTYVCSVRQVAACDIVVYDKKYVFSLHPVSGTESPKPLEFPEQ